MYDAVNWSLVRLPPISCAYAPRIPLKFMGCNKRAPGKIKIHQKIVFQFFLLTSILISNNEHISHKHES